MGTRLICLLSIAFLLVVVGHTQAELVSHWTFEEGAGTQVSDVVGGNHGTVSDTPTWIEGVFGGAMEFAGSGSADGSGYRIDCGNDASLNIGNEISLAMWIRPDAEDPESGMETAAMCKALSSASPSWSFQVRYGWGGPEPTMAFTFNTSPRAWVFVGQDLEQGEWCHIACSHDGSTLRCYLNGEETDSTPMGAVTNSPAPLLIGSDGWGSDWIGGIDDVRYYNHGLTPEEIVDVMLAGGGPELAADPAPEDEAVDIPRGTLLSWSPGEFAATHDVYLGTVFDDVNDASRSNPLDVLIGQGQSDNTYAPDRLEFGQTYYWRVDEVNAAPDSTIFKGAVWSFATEPMAYPIAGVVASSNAPADADSGPEKMVDGSGLNAIDLHSTSASDMWLGIPEGADPVWIQFEFDGVYKLHEMVVWNYNSEFELALGFGIKDVAVEYSSDGVEWTAFGDVTLAQAPAEPDYAANTVMDMQGVAARYVRLAVNSAYGVIGRYGLSEVRFLSVPVQARASQPTDAATEVDVNTELSWRAGREAASHEVYLDTDEAAVVDGTVLADTVTQSSYSPDDLEFGNTYYWKVIEVNEAEAIASWEGNVWSFSTQEYAVIDDFEAYDDEENRIYDTWVDGWVNDSGSTVGYMDAPFAEKTIVNSGSQSMPLLYDNTDSPFYSEAERDLGSQDWTGNGADTLIVNFRGRAPEFLETDDGRILVNSIGADVWGTADQFRYVYKRLSGDGSIVARVDYLMNTSGWAKAGVMIREGLDAGSSHAMTVVTPANGVAMQYRPVMNQTSFGINEAGLVAPYWVKLTRSGSSFTAERSEDGINWVSITADAADSTVQVEMGTDVYIGLMAGSINANAVGAATFSNITTTGNVTGVWETSGIGVEQPVGNALEPLYVAVEDGAGNVQVVNHPDALAALTMEWQEWQIPFSALSGVNLSSVRTMYIGLGDRDNPTAGGTGLIYIDDIGFGRPAPVVEPVD